MRRGIGFRVIAPPQLSRFFISAIRLLLLIGTSASPPRKHVWLAAGVVIFTSAVFQTGRAISIAEGEGVLEEVHIVALGTAFIQTLMRAAGLFTRQRRVRHTFPPRSDHDPVRCYTAGQC